MEKHKEFELTSTAQRLKDIRENGQDIEAGTEEDNLATCMGSEDFGYALFDGGYVRPDEWLTGKSLEEVKNAIDVVREFKKLVESLHDEI